MPKRKQQKRGRGSSGGSSSGRKRKKQRKNVSATKPQDDVNNEGEYYEVDQIVGNRKRRGGKREFLVKWKGYDSSEDMWVPEEDLCDTAMEEATKHLLAEQEKKLGLRPDDDGEIEEEKDKENKVSRYKGHEKEDDESTGELGRHYDDNDDEEQKQRATKQDDDDDNHDPWDWTDEEQITYHEIERIDVGAEGVGERVDDARRSGIPICLVGHRGWAQFSTRWLRSIQPPQSPPPAASHPSGGGGLSQSEFLPKPKTGPHPPQQPQPQPQQHPQEDMRDYWLDLSQPHEVDAELMSRDIGDEAVPVIRKNYNEHNPIHGEISASAFLERCWPKSVDGKEDDDGDNGDNGDNDDDEGKKKRRRKKSKGTSLYLHQWQFPLSETAAKKMCGPGACRPLPNGILGEDLLRYWLDEDKCRGDSPYQYIFMGREDTASNLHRDNGGLLITIAPIVGQKEVLLVHRQDGAACMDHLNADLNRVDLHRYPLMCHARIWKSVVSPGEILLMPQGTYHQCRNVTPCLSYSRFFLDTINLRPFLESMFDQDAPEIDHDDVVWNAATALRDRLDRLVDEERERRKNAWRDGNGDSSLRSAPLSDETVRAVDTLRALRNIVREFARRFRAQNKLDSAKLWDQMVVDIDSCLHDFRFRRRDRLPPFRPRREKWQNSQETAAADNNEKGHVDLLDEEDVSGDESLGNGPHRSESDLERALRRAPNVKPAKRYTVIPDAIPLMAGDAVAVRVAGKRVRGNILRAEKQMRAAFLRFDDYSRFHDEHVPYDRLRKPVAGESSVPIGRHEAVVRPGAVVVIYAEGGEEYRAKVQTCKEATFYLLRLELPDPGTDGGSEGEGGPHSTERWFARDDIIEKWNDDGNDESCGDNENGKRDEGKVGGSPVASNPPSSPRRPMANEAAVTEQLRSSRKNTAGGGGSNSSHDSRASCPSTKQQLSSLIEKTQKVVTSSPSSKPTPTAGSIPPSVSDSIIDVDNPPASPLRPMANDAAVAQQPCPSEQNTASGGGSRSSPGLRASCPSTKQQLPPPIEKVRTVDTSSSFSKPTPAAGSVPPSMSDPIIDVDDDGDHPIEGGVAVTEQPHQLTHNAGGCVGGSHGSLPSSTARVDSPIPQSKPMPPRFAGNSVIDVDKDEHAIRGGYSLVSDPAPSHRRPMANEAVVKENTNPLVVDGSCPSTVEQSLQTSGRAQVDSLLPQSKPMPTAGSGRPSAEHSIIDVDNDNDPSVGGGYPLETDPPHSSNRLTITEQPRLSARYGKCPSTTQPSQPPSQRVDSSSSQSKTG